MHMADALISPAVGGTLWVSSAGIITYASKKLKKDIDDTKIPLMGVLGAFIFAAQMINFTIPGTGSSGHIGGGLLLAIVLGPHAAFICMVSVLMVQALFFGDGGLLALGCNIFNMGFIACYIAYPLIYKKFTNAKAANRKIILSSIAAAVVSLQLGAFCVVLQTTLSGISELPFSAFIILMQPVHLAIGLVEGLATAAIVVFIKNTHSGLISTEREIKDNKAWSLKKVAAVFLIATAVTAGAVSWLASTYPDGLEWSIAKTTGKEELDGNNSAVHAGLMSVQKKTAVLPDYNLPAADGPAGEDKWPGVDPGTSLAGLIGGAFTLMIIVLAGLVLRSRKGGS